MGVGAVPVQLDWLNSALSPVVYRDIVLSINTQYSTISTSYTLRFLRYSPDNLLLTVHQPKHSPAHPDAMGENNTRTALEGPRVKIELHAVTTFLLCVSTVDVHVGNVATLST